MPKKENQIFESRRFRIYPNEEQKAFLTFNMFANIKMWNALLAEVYKPVSESDEIQALPRNKRSKETYYHIKKMTWEEQKELFDRLKKLTTKSIYAEDKTVFENGLMLKDADTSMYSYTKRTLQTAMNNHLKNPKHFGIPRFKSTMDVNRLGSYSTGTQVCNLSDDGYQLKPGKFSRFKLGWIEVANHYPSNGRLYKVTLIHEPSDNWYVSLVFEQAEHTVKRPKTGLVASIDLNTSGYNHMVLSDGTIYQLPLEEIKKLEAKIEKENRKLSRKYEQWKKDVALIEADNKDALIPKPVPTLAERGNYQKNRKKIAKLHLRIKNLKKDYIKKTCSKLANKYDLIVMEDLGVANMEQDKYRARNVARSNFREVRDTLTYMMDWADKQIVFIDQFSPSSKRCHDCGYIKQNLKLSDRKWTCPECGAHHDHDLNATKNILDEGLELLEKMQSDCKKCGHKRLVITTSEQWNCTKCGAKNGKKKKTKKTSDKVNRTTH